jgi:L-histidine Nalpha-methyltransferase
VSRVRLAVHVRRPAALAADVWRGLTSQPKELPPKWFFEPTEGVARAERDLLCRHATEIAALSGADTLVELGPGTSDTTHILLEAIDGGGRLMRFAALDLREDTLRRAGEALEAEYPGVQIELVVADLERDLRLLPAEGQRLVTLLGGAFGLYPPTARGRLLAGLAAALRPEETLLVSADLVTDEARLVRAARFDENVLLVLNGELGADFEPARFEPVAVWKPDTEWIETQLRARDAHTVHVRAIGIEAEFAAGEPLRTGIAAKLRRPGLDAELGAAGFNPLGAWSDEAGDVLLSLWRRGGRSR